MTKLEELQAAFDAIPKQDWMYAYGLSAVVYIDEHKVKVAADLGKIDNSKELGEFIALAHNMMPQLLEAVELLKAYNTASDYQFATDSELHASAAALLEHLK